MANPAHRPEGWWRVQQMIHDSLRRPGSSLQGHALHRHAKANLAVPVELHAAGGPSSEVLLVKQ